MDDGPSRVWLKLIGTTKPRSCTGGASPQRLGQLLELYLGYGMALITRSLMNALSCQGLVGALAGCWLMQMVTVCGRPVSASPC